MGDIPRIPAFLLFLACTCAIAQVVGWRGDWTGLWHDADRPALHAE